MIITWPFDEFAENMTTIFVQTTIEMNQQTQGVTEFHFCSTHILMCKSQPHPHYFRQMRLERIWWWSSFDGNLGWNFARIQMFQTTNQIIVSKNRKTLVMVLTWPENHDFLKTMQRHLWRTSTCPTCGIKCKWCHPTHINSFRTDVNPHDQFFYYLPLLTSTNSETTLIIE